MQICMQRYLYIFMYVSVYACVWVCVIMVAFGGTTYRDGVYHLASRALCKYAHVTRLKLHCLVRTKANLFFNLSFSYAKHAHFLQVLWFSPLPKLQEKPTCMIATPKCIKVHNPQILKIQTCQLFWHQSGRRLSYYSKKSMQNMHMIYPKN